MNKKNNPNHLFKPIYLLCVLLIVIVLLDPIKNFVKLQIKKQNLRTFYTQLSTAENQKQWSTLYDFLPNSTRRFVSRQQFMSYAPRNPNLPYSARTTINNIEINGDVGKINRTNIQCVTAECTGSNQKVDTSDRTYVFINGRWKIPENEPSEKALSLASFMSTISTKTEQQNAINKWSSYGVSNVDYAIHNFALFLDNDSIKMAETENWVENYKANQNKRVIIQRQIPLPEYKTPEMPKTTRCHTTGFGQFANTTCTTY